MVRLFYILLFIACPGLLRALDNNESPTHTSANRTKRPTNSSSKSEWGNYLIMMDDPYGQDDALYDRIFDPNITKNMYEKKFGGIQSSDEARIDHGLDYKRREDQKQAEEDNEHFSRWVSKKLIQHHIEKSMEEAPKKSAVGYAQAARMIVQNYHVQVTPGNEFSMGYDLPSNKAKLGLKSGVFGQHYIYANFNEENVGPRELQEFFYTGDKKIHTTNFVNRYSFIQSLETFRIEQDLFYDGLILAYQASQNLHLPTHEMEHFIGLAFSKTF